jgi:transposase
MQTTGRFAGIDWASEKHDVLVQDADGTQVLLTTFAHSEIGISLLCGKLIDLGVVLVAIERPDGLLVDRLLAAGLQVMALHPNQVAAARSRFRASGGKSDRYDAFVLCELARTDSHRFRVLIADQDQTKAIAALTAARKDLVQARVRLTNQLREELQRFWPGPIGLFSELDSQISLAFLARYPSPLEARTLGEKRMAAFLRGRSYSGKKAPAELLERLRAAPAPAMGEQETLARREVVLALIAAIGPITTQISELTGQIDERLDAHPDGQIFRSFFASRQSVICAATLLSRMGDCRARYPTFESLAAVGGQSPIAVESGKRKVAKFRRACDHDLRSAISVLADSSRHRDPWAADRYKTARAHGHDHPRAIRTLGRSWTRVLWRCWQDGVPYDPARHQGLQKHLTVTIPSSSGPRPDLTATQRMAGTDVTRRAAQAERAALDDKPTSATHHPGG